MVLLNDCAILTHCRATNMHSLAQVSEIQRSEHNSSLVPGFIPPRLDHCAVNKTGSPVDATAFT